MEEQFEELKEPLAEPVENQKPRSAFVKWLRHSMLALLVLTLIISPTAFYAINGLRTSVSTFSIIYPGLQYDILNGDSTKLDGELKTYSVDGESLYIATVEFVENPTAWEVLMAKLNPEADVISPDENVNIVYNVPTAIIDYNEDEIGVSLKYALASALTYLKIPYESSLDIADVTIIDENDNRKTYDYVTLVELDGQKISTFKQVEDYMFEIKDDSEIPLTVRLKNGEEHDLIVKPSYSKTLKRYALGFYAIPRFSFPSEYKFNIDGVKGGSAGLVLAIAAVERLTPETIIPKGQIIGGTGAIDSSGEVVEIAGLQQKIYAAHKAKNNIFFIPSTMCKEVKTFYEDMKIVPVKTLTDAINQLENAKANKPLNSCSASK